MTAGRRPVVEFPRLYRPTWAEVDLGVILANLRKLKRRVRGAELLLVVKANGYGHGAVEVARAAEQAGLVRGFGVSSVEEGIALREAGIRRSILILGSLYPFESTMAAIRYGLTPTVASLEGARLIEQAAESMERLHADGTQALPLSCHLKIDTGMSRVGVRWPAGREVVDYLERAPGVRLEGVFTHLACAENDVPATRRQLRQFRAAVREIERRGRKIPCRHAANSAAAMRFPESRWDMIRPGLAAYGLYPGFAPALSLKTRIVFLKSVPRATPVSYGALYRTRRKSRIATLPIGYGDGLPRLISLARRGRPGVLLKGRRCPIVGAITMDMTMVDVSGVPDAAVGDEIVLIGRQGRAMVSAGDLAQAAQTIPYEIVTGLQPRLPRIYIR
ncbi:MAG: alanine racemase [Elusimicrobiota bacterium]